MKILADILIIIVAIEHLLFLVLEMFLWTKPLGLKVFRQSASAAQASATLAANQGLYNGFLAAGLIWSLVGENSEATVFFLWCVTIAGVFGAATVNRRIFFVQAVPAIGTLITLWAVL
jgi:putative membrane protein